MGNKVFTWKNGRELATYNDGSNNISYEYDVSGIRTSKTVNGIKISYILEDSTIVFESRNGYVLYYIYNGDELLGFVYDGTTYYYHKNIFSDIIGILDSDYNEVVTYTYDSFGNTLSIVDNSNINLGTINPFRYRSYYYDEETGLYYLNSRYYNPKIGRFINSDYIINSNFDFVSNNLFSYTSNNFINYEDKIGTSIKSAFTFLRKGAKETVYNCMNFKEKSSYLKTEKKSKSTGSKNNTFNKSENKNKMPSSGEPNTRLTSPNGNIRVFGPDGKWLKDLDYGHPQYHPELDNPHIHDVDWEGKIPHRHTPRNAYPGEVDDSLRLKDVTKVTLGFMATVGVGYLIYRGVRLLPSLTPVTWWTLPYNLVTP